MGKRLRNAFQHGRYSAAQLDFVVHVRVGVCIPPDLETRLTDPHTRRRAGRVNAGPTVAINRAIRFKLS
jgi:hypothetical protein